jgi:hypothetical protein
MLGRDHPLLKGPRSGSGIPGLAGLPAHPGRVAERPMDRTRQRRRWRLLGRGRAADHVGVRSFEREHLMMEQNIPDSHDDDAALLRTHERLSRVSKHWCGSQRQSVCSGVA